MTRTAGRIAKHDLILAGIAPEMLDEAQRRLARAGIRLVQSESSPTWDIVIDSNVNEQPVSAVEWIPRDQLHANDYNPNRVAPPELRLLKLSILEDGWTQPIVARPDGQIVDGFHRWTVAADHDVAQLTGGLVPVVRLTSAQDDPAGQRMATIRHNRARGTHAVVKMADITAELEAMGVPKDEIARRLQMDEEEVTRLLQRGKMTERGANPDGLNEAWAPARPDVAPGP